MKKGMVIPLVAVAVAGMLNAPVVACTGIRLTAKDGGVVVGRTMEFGFDVKSET